MTDWQQTLIAPSSPILDAIRRLDTTASQICLVVDEAGRLSGTVTDGDIRRGILNGIALSEAVSRIMNPHPVTTKPGDEPALVLATMNRLNLRQIPVVESDGTVVGLATLTNLMTSRQRPNWAILMAGGEGRRLRPLTEETPKPMIEVGDRPILETILTNLAAVGFQKFFLSINYKAHLVKDHFGDGAKWGVDIQYLHEESQLGTGGALGLLPEPPVDDILIMNGDILTNVNFAQLLDFHAEVKAAATMCVREYDFQVPYGVVETDGHRLIRIEEKPVVKKFVNGGIYILNPIAFAHVKPGEPLTMPSLFETLMAEGNSCAVFPLREYWIDVGRFEDLDRARGEFSSFFG